MNLVIGTSCYSPRERERMPDFLDSLSRAVRKYGRKTTIVIVLNGEEKDVTRYKIDMLIEKYFYDMEFLEFDIRAIAYEGKLLYSSVMYNRVSIAREHCDEDSFYWNADNDYVFNPYCFSLTHKIFEENKHVHYVSMLKPVIPVDMQYKIVNLSGVEFIPVPSMLGGAFAARWNVFKAHTDAYSQIDRATSIKPGKQDTMFDKGFFQFVCQKQMGTMELVYSLHRVSLVQHCNRTSSYLDAKHEQSMFEHAYGMNFDPLVNPFKLFGIGE